jgi:hypothetical protein
LPRVWVLDSDCPLHCSVATLLPVRILLSLLAVSTAMAAEFPAPQALPAHPELPDPLVMLDGTKITTKTDWERKRADELRELFQHYMYGRRPGMVRPIEGEVLREDPAALGGKAILREVAVNCGLAEPVHLLLVIPKERAKPAACFLGMNFNGNYQLLDDPKLPLPRWMKNPATAEAGRGKEKETWAIEQSIARGYAVATFYSGDVVPDDKALALEVLKKFAGEQDAPQGDDPATIMCWAWGFSRLLDYLESVPEIDAKRVAVVGHSRNGKTALLAAAMDPRFALAIPSQAGCGGSAPSRVAPELRPADKPRPIAETVAVINNAFPHWFCGHFKAFNDAVEKLPFDQHALIALCAPRPVLLSNAAEDLWANPDGQYAMLQAAAPVYALYGDAPKLPATRPAMGALLNERLGYFIRPGKHSMTTLDWQTWLDFADRWLK